MSRYIDADEIVDFISRWGGNSTAEDCLEWIKKSPTADVRENVKGKWITANEQPYFRKHYNNVVCSVCHRKGDSRWNFCPNCGADMRGGNNA